MKYLLVLAPVLFVTFAFADPPWTRAVEAADCGDTINEGESCIASDGSYIYCICNTNERNRFAVIPYGRSTDGGATWNTIWWKDPSVGISWHSDPVLLRDDTGYVHMFVQFSTTVERHYLSTDHGVTWCESTDVSERLPSGTVDKPWACYYGNNLYMAWQQWGATQEGIMFAKSTDRGRTWTRTVADPTRTGITGITCSPSGIIYLMNRYWGGDGTYCTRSTDQGSTWGPWVTVDPAGSYTAGYGDRAPLPSIAAPTDTNVVITWVDDRFGTWDILYSRSTDGGMTWTPTAVLNDSAAGGQCKGWVNADPFGHLHFIWYHTPSWPTSASSYWSVRYQHSEDYGATISPSMRLSDTTFRSPVSFMGEYHMVVTDSQRARCVWTDGRAGDLDLYFAQAELSQIGVQENPWQVTRMSRVWMNVPAAVRGSTVPVDFSLGHAELVKLEAFDASGRKRAEKSFGHRSAGSYHECVSGLPSGQALFLKLTAGATVTRKCTLLR
jgi:hypothetical protein